MRDEIIQKVVTEMIKTVNENEVSFEEAQRIAEVFSRAVQESYEDGMQLLRKGAVCEVNAPKWWK